MLCSETVSTSFDECGESYIDSIEYDLHELRVFVSFASGESIVVSFADPRGFRVLDEGNLNEFWADGSRSNGWLWQITSGGWLDQESQRWGFLRVMTPGVEYLVVGSDDCVSVLSPNPPVVTPESGAARGESREG